MEYRLVIPYALAGLNEYISAERANRHAAAKLKAQIESGIIMLCRQQLRGVKIENPVYMRYLWVEKHMRRDKDNISSFGRKVIQDALVKSGVLKNDGWANITGFADEFAVDREKPRVEVIIEEITETS